MADGNVRGESPELKKGANAVFKSWKLHSWYIDPNTVIFCLANGNKAVPDEVKEAMAKKLHSLDRPKINEYDIKRKNCSGFMPTQEEFLLYEDGPPSLVEYVNEESWLVFDILQHGPAEVKWMLFSTSEREKDPDYFKFKKFVQQLAVVNDAGERAVKAVQETVSQTTSEKKLQKMMLVKGKIKKPMARTKESYQLAASQLTPKEQLHLAAMKYGVEDESDSSSDDEAWVSDAEIDSALLAENEIELTETDDEELPDPEHMLLDN